MATSHRTVVLLLLLLAQTVVYVGIVNAQTGTGFISLDCGKPADYSGTDSVTGLTYTSDNNFIESGEVHTVTTTSDYTHSKNLRSFPTGNRNCYSLTNIEMGRLHLVRVFFFYGNYDGKNSPPTFDIYLDVNRWDTITIPKESTYHHSEILATAISDTMWLCLINTGKGTPFISAIDVRPMVNSMYTHVNTSWSLVTRYRLDFGGTNEIRYKDDPYDRIWQPYNKPEWSIKSTTSSVDVSNAFLPAVIAMQTAAIPKDGLRLDFKLAISMEPQYYVYMHFAELESLPQNKTRVVDIYRDKDEWYFGFTLRYLSLFTTYTPMPKTYDNLNISIRKADNSTQPPSFNAMEVYEVRKLTEVTTYGDDVGAIMTIKDQYKLKKNWNGDPCLPKGFVWDGLNCSYSDSQPSRIILLTLASSGLSGPIPFALEKLTELEHLDLSDNQFTGQIPKFLGNLPNLHFLDLSNNMLNLSSTPKSLEEKKASGALTLILEKTSDNSPQAVEAPRKSNKLVIAFPTSIGFAVVIVLLVLFLLRGGHNKQPNEGERQPTGREPKIACGEGSSFPTISSDNRKFTYQDLVKITDNFKSIIGEGGFGTVFYGELTGGPPVAVKMLKESTPEGPKQFHREAQILAKIYHKNLVSLVGYCNDEGKLGLIYEFMAQGSLADHLTGVRKMNALSWRDRLRISIEAAQGLQYLHSGCNPPIVHRDVKTSNILLGKNFEVRIGDFGLSRNFPTDTVSQAISIAGTPGYMDPEYYNSGGLNEKSDVYSFGVVLLELITGLPAINKKESLVEWVKPRADSGDLRKLVDPIIKDYNPNSAWKVIEVAKACVAPTARRRPSMMEVLIMLKECMELENTTYGSHASSEINEDDSQDIFHVEMSSIQNPPAR